MSRRLAKLVGIAGFVGGGVACRSPHDAELKVEATRVAHAVDALRSAVNTEKAAPLAELQGTSCSDAEVCQTKELCSQAYVLFIQGINQVNAIKELDRTNPQAVTLEPLEQSERTLTQSRELMQKCSEAEARISARFRL